MNEEDNDAFPKLKYWSSNIFIWFKEDLSKKGVWGFIKVHQKGKMNLPTKLNWANNELDTSNPVVDLEKFRYV